MHYSPSTKTIIVLVEGLERQQLLLVVRKMKTQGFCEFDKVSI